MMLRLSVGLLCASLLSVAAPSNAQTPQPAPPGPSSATFPGGDPALQPAPPPPAAPAPMPAPAPGAAPGAVPAPEAAPAPAPAAAAAAAPAVIAEPPPPPPRSTDSRPNRAKRPFFIGGELGWNGLAGFGVNFSYHPIPYLALDSGLGIALTGVRVGVRVRANFLTSEWTPFVGLGMTYSPDSGGEEFEIETQGEKVKLELLPSAYVQFAGGVNYTGGEGFVFMATTGYATLVASNTRFKSGSFDAYKEDVRPLYRGGLIVSVAFGYAF